VVAVGIGSVVFDGVAAQGVNGGDEHKHTCVEYGETPPLVPYVGQHSSFA